jgi:predicted transcriptional regulator
MYGVIMRKAAPLSIRVPEEPAERLDALAKATDRSKSFLAVQAIEEFVTVQEWQVAAIMEGIAEADAGKVVPHEKAVEELSTWSSRIPVSVRNILRSSSDGNRAASSTKTISQRISLPSDT